MADELARLDATTQAELVRRREVTPRELVDAAIARIEKLNPALPGSERLVRKNFESQFLCIKLQCGVLIANRNTGDADSTNHVVPPRETQPNLHGPAVAISQRLL